MNIILEDIFGRYDGFIYKPRKPTNAVVEDYGINDSPFVVAPTIKGIKIKHPAYRAWSGMLNRCYNSKFKNKNTSYNDVTCCEEWLLFTNFAKWFKENYIEGWQLDKDLLTKDNTIYSPTNCVFVPTNINNFLSMAKHSSDLPYGVCKHGNSYQASIGSGITAKSIYLGRFNTKEEAHREWQKAKLEQAIAFNFPPLQRVIDQLKFEIENNLETTSL
jgi:hypothetical protein